MCASPPTCVPQGLTSGEQVTPAVQCTAWKILVLRAAVLPSLRLPAQEPSQEAANFLMSGTVACVVPHQEPEPGTGHCGGTVGSPKDLKAAQGCRAGAWHRPSAPGRVPASHAGGHHLAQCRRLVHRPAGPATHPHSPEWERPLDLCWKASRAGEPGASSWPFKQPLSMRIPVAGGRAVPCPQAWTGSSS